MRIRCTGCSATGNVKIEDPTKQFKCPKCGGVMKAAEPEPVMKFAEAPESAPQEPAPPTEAPESSVKLNISRRAGSGRKSVTEKTMANRKIPKRTLVLTGVSVGLIAILGIVIYVNLSAPNVGPATLGMLPGNTIMAASVDKIARLQNDADTASHSGSTLQGALDSYRERSELWLSRTMGIPGDRATRLVRGLAAVGVGRVPLDKGYADVFLLAFSSSGTLSDVTDTLTGTGQVAGTEMFKSKQGTFFACLGNVAILCERREPIETILANVVNNGSDRLELNDAFIEARKSVGQVGRAWLYVSDTQVNALGLRYAAVNANFNMSSILFSGKSAPAGMLNLGPAVAFDAAQNIPADSTLAVALNPTAIGAIDQPVFSAWKTLVGLEQAKSFSAKADLLPLLDGQAVFFAVPDAPETFAMAAKVKDTKAAQAFLDKICEKEGAAPVAGLTTRTIAASTPLVCALAGDVIVIAPTPQGIAAVAQAGKGRSIKDKAEYQAAMKSMPPMASAWFVIQENARTRTARQSDKAAIIVGTVISNEKGTEIVATAPEAREWVMSLVPSEGTGSSDAPVTEPAR